MSLEQNAVIFAAQETNINARDVLSVLNLMITEQCTVPFVARYRKEVTGGMDEVQIRAIHESYENYIERGLNLAGRVEFVKNKIQTGEEDYDMLKKKVYNNIRTISLNLNVKNITGENLEESKLYTTIIFEYPNETKEFNFDSKRINLDNSSLWYNDEIKTINFEYAFNFLDRFD